jgi:2-C-methyl-D-erythritol 4-phosphate cytidylyltransferase
MDRVTAIIVAAGEGKRFGLAKQFAPLKGKSVLDWCLEKFEKHPGIDNIVLVIGEPHPSQEYARKYKKITSVTEGGERRQDSVYAGLGCVDEKITRIVLIHDGARPLVGEDLIKRTIEAAGKKEAVVPVIPLDDTIKRVEGERIIQTEDRTHLYRSQTPQGFSCSLLKEAFISARRDGFYGTDEASLVERVGKKVFVIQGDPKNIKITTQDDLRVAEVLIED